MSYAARIIEKFGGTRAMAAAMSLPPTTIQSWKGSGLIPAKHHQAVLDLARDRTIALGPHDFFEPSNSTASTKQAAA